MSLEKSPTLRVLIVDDEPLSTKVLASLLKDHASSVEQAISGSEALDMMESAPFDLVVTDLIMPGMDGFGLVKRIRANYPEVLVFIFTGNDSFSLAKNALQVGADAYLLKPLDKDQFAITLQQALEKRNLHKKIDELGKLVEDQWAKTKIVGQTRAIRDLQYLIEKARHSRAPVLIQGESGTGKELVARAICGGNPKDLEKFVSVNCCAISEGLIESELFGHVRGAFSGATSDRKGLFEVADGGTLFLDEIGDISPALQMKLLRVLQEKEVRRVGDNFTRIVNVRILAATNKNLLEAIAQGTFREDLYYRLNVIPLKIPPLRDRIEDIPLLAEHFIQKYQNGQTPRKLHPDTTQVLQSYTFPGNIRELENIIQRALSLSSHTILLPSDFIPYFQEPNPHLIHKSKNSNKRHSKIISPPLTKASPPALNSPDIYHSPSQLSSASPYYQAPSSEFKAESPAFPAQLQSLPTNNFNSSLPGPKESYLLPSLGLLPHLQSYPELKKALLKMEKEWIEHFLKQNKGSVQETALALGIGRTALHNRITKLLINIEELRNHVSR